MTDKLPRIGPADVIRVLEKVGFSLVRQSGSHRVYKNCLGKRVTVPYHPGKTLHPKIMKSILMDSGLTLKEFLDLMK